MESPQARLAELTDILSLFEDGAAPDLRAQIEGQLLIEKANLEQQAAEAQKVQETFGVGDNEQLKIGVALLAEEVNVATAEAKDWEAISLAMRENNNKLREALAQAQVELAKRPASKMLEDAQARIAFLEAQRRRQLFAYNEETKALEEQLTESKGKIAEAAQKFDETAKAVVRKTQEMKALEERLNVAEKVATDRKQLVEKIGKEKASYDAVMAEAKDTIDRLSSQVSRLQANLRTTQEERDQVTQEFTQYKEDLVKANTPNMEPRFAERARGYLNFDESGGAAVEGYWTDLVAKYGESIVPYERQIRSCKTYREAYSQFLKILPDIDENARAVAMSRMPDSVGITRQERLETLTEAGMSYGNDKGVIDRNSSWAQ
jgi:DNA repair exonuclease SbcCD ATPase subunit